MRAHPFIGILGVMLVSTHASFAEPAPSEDEIGKEEQFLTREQAAREVFPNAVNFEQEAMELSPEAIAGIEKKLGHSFEEHAPVFAKAIGKTGELLGYGLVLDEKGKYRPITLLVGSTPKFEVADVAVMVYRESRGGEVRKKRFLKQFHGKSLSDPIRVHRDVIHISGATISSVAVASAVRRALLLTEAAYAPRQETPQ